MHFHHYLLLLLLFFPAILGIPPPPPPPQGGDARALLEFRKGIRDGPSGLLSSWAPPAAGTSHCSWRGVSCGDDAGSVVALALDGLSLSGDLKFTTLAGMRSLQNLTLSHNNFTGRLVPTMGSMASLQRLDLSGNMFSGKIPDRIADLWALVHLNLSHNQFSQSLPPRIRNLQQLRVIDLRSNGLSGDVGSVLSGLSYTEYVDLSSNRFYGGLLMESGNLSDLASTLRYLNLSNNELGGGFLSTESVRLFKNLEVLDVGGNRLTGQLPVFDSMFSLKVLRVGNNLMYGPVPEELFGSAVPLAELDLSGNGFTGKIQSINSTTLKFLNLSSNGLSGSLPLSLGSCLSVDLSQNMLSGDLSMMQDWGDAVVVINLSSNTLSGYYPSEISQLKNLMSINMRNNSLMGALPSVLGRYPRLSVLDLSSNRFTGSIFPGILSSLTLTNLNLSANFFSGNIPFQSSHSTESLLLLSSSSLQSLDLSDNSLSGSLPQGIGSLQRLQLLSVRNNTLSGDLPSELGKLDELEFLDLSFNRFKGKIPEMLQASLNLFNVSYNDLSGVIPQSLQRFPSTSFYPGNNFLVLPGAVPPGPYNPGANENEHSKSRMRVAFIVGSVGVVLLIFFVLMAFYRMRSQKFCGINGFRCQASGTDAKFSIFTRPNIFKSSKDQPVPVSMSFSNAQLLAPASRSLSAQKELLTETAEHVYSDSKGRDPECAILDAPEHLPHSTGSNSSPGSPFSSSPHLIDFSTTEQPVVLDVYSPDRLAGELFFLDGSLVFTAEELSRAPAEVLGRSSHGTSYKATLDNGHMLTVKWFRVGLVKHKKHFAKEAKWIGTIRHANIISWRGYYWGPREQERLIIADYVHGDSLALQLYEKKEFAVNATGASKTLPVHGECTQAPRRLNFLAWELLPDMAMLEYLLINPSEKLFICSLYSSESTPRRYARLSVRQRLKIAIGIAQCLCHLHHDWDLPHGNLKPSNILLTSHDLTAKLTDYGLHRLMTSKGTAEQILNSGALGYRAPELAISKPIPSFKADVYAFGVILMELLTRKSAGDIISGQSGAVDLTDWVQMCTREGRGTDCFDRDIAGLEEAPRVMDELLSISLRCILPVNDRPNIRTVYDELSSITM